MTEEKYIEMIEEELTKLDVDNPREVAEHVYNLLWEHLKDDS